MKKEEIIENFNEIIESKGLSISDTDDIFAAMSEILDFMAEEVQKNEPYATSIIKIYRDAGMDISDPDSASDCICNDD